MIFLFETPPPSSVILLALPPICSLPSTFSLCRDGFALDIATHTTRTHTGVLCANSRALRCVFGACIPVPSQITNPHKQEERVAERVCVCVCVMATDAIEQSIAARACVRRGCPNGSTQVRDCLWGDFCSHPFILGSLLALLTSSSRLVLFGSFSRLRLNVIATCQTHRWCVNGLLAFHRYRDGDIGADGVCNHSFQVCFCVFCIRMLVCSESNAGKQYFRLKYPSLRHSM